EDQLPDSLFILDTDLTVFQIWMQEKYQENPDWIHERLQSDAHKIYFLCDVDVPWEPDPQREHPNPNDRLRLFSAYRDLLDRHGLTYYIISGDVPTRMKKCKKIIDSYQLS
ncbi:MAG: AAA family ATPase, partial [Flavobacteriales bacterium]|nr:AAA family ATPase [Flavobacteriales bacterium]